jgi:hypothetical protein
LLQISARYVGANETSAAGDEYVTSLESHGA